LAEAGVELAGSAEGAVQGSIEALSQGDFDLKVTVGAGCALAELDDAAKVVTDASAEVEASASACAEVMGVVTGG